MVQTILLIMQYNPPSLQKIERSVAAGAAAATTTAIAWRPASNASKQRKRARSLSIDWTTRTTTRTLGISRPKTDHILFEGPHLAKRQTP